MSDNISRQKLIEELTDVIIKHTCKPSGCQDCLCAFEYGIVEESCEEYLEYHKLAEKIYNEFVINITNQQPPEDQWIPCSSGKMPDNGQTVVVTIKSTDAYRFMVVLTYHETKPKCFTDNDWQGEGFYHYIWGDWVKRENVIAWMPAEPYKGVK